jgi:hypothetical protein
MTDTPSAAQAQAPSASTPRRRRFHFEPAPIDPALRKRRIKIARAFNLICRTKCSVAVALRAVGLDYDHNAREDVCDLLDRKGISRIRKGVRRVRFPETPSRVFEEFIPRQEKDVNRLNVFVPRQDAKHVSHLPPSRRTLAEMVQELMAVADPLGDDGGEKTVLKQDGFSKKPRPPIICASCARGFQGNRGARFCSGRCRIRNWRAR